MKPKRVFNSLVDDNNWKTLYRKHVDDLTRLNAISSVWQAGINKLDIPTDKLPTAAELTESIAYHTGYSFIQTDDHVIHEQRKWYGMIANYEMPLSCFLRTPEELGYCDEPDIWHDIMGHIPFLAEQAYSDMYQLLASTYIQAFDDQRLELIQQLDFIGGMLIELGLIKEQGQIKAFGSTFYSSSEVFEAFKSENQIVYTDDALTSGETYNRHHFQGKYYILNSIEELVEIIHNIKRAL